MLVFPTTHKCGNLIRKNVRRYQMHSAEKLSVRQRTQVPKQQACLERNIYWHITLRRVIAVVTNINHFQNTFIYMTDVKIICKQKPRSRMYIYTRMHKLHTIK